MDVFYKWNHTIGGLSCLAYSTWHHVFEVRPRRSTYRYFIPFCGSILFHRTDRPHFVYPAVARRVRCFHLPAVVNSAAVNKCVFGSLFPLPGGIYLQMELSHLLTMFKFSRTCQPFPKWLNHFTFPPAILTDFSAPLPTLVILCFVLFF